MREAFHGEWAAGLYRSKKRFRPSSHWDKSVSFCGTTRFGGKTRPLSPYTACDRIQPLLITGRVPVRRYCMRGKPHGSSCPHKSIQQGASTAAIPPPAALWNEDIPCLLFLLNGLSVIYYSRDSPACQGVSSYFFAAYSSISAGNCPPHRRSSPSTVSMPERLRYQFSRLMPPTSAGETRSSASGKAHW